MLWLNTSDAKIYRYVQVPDVWQFEELTSPTTVYLCDMSLLVGTEDFGSYSIVVLGANNWYTLSYYKGVDLLDRAEMLSLIQNKVDKVTGKSLISDTEITRLGTLSNYNDTELRSLIADKRDDLTVVESTETTVSISVSGNTYYKFSNPLTSLEITAFITDEKETILDFTTDSTFTFTYPISLYNLYGNDITINQKVLIVIRNGVMEIRKRAESSASSGGLSAKLYPTTIDSATTGYKKIMYMQEVAETILSQTLTNETVTLGTFLFDSEIATDTIPAGVWLEMLRCKVDSLIGAGVNTILTTAFLYHKADGTTTELFTVESDPILSTTYTNKIKEFPNTNSYSCLFTDRLGFVLKAKSTSTQPRTISLVLGDGNASYVETPLAYRHDFLRAKDENPNFLHSTSAEKADYAIKSYKTELVVAPTSGGTLTLKNGYITVISTTLTNSHSFTIALPTPVSGYCNECGVKFKIGASLPTIVRPTIAKWRSDEFIAAINSSRVIIFEQDTFDGTTWENYATCDKN